ADATGTNQPDVTDIFCGKPQRSPASEPTKARTTAESRRNPGFSFLPTVKQRQGMAGKPHDDSRRFIERVEFVGLAQKRKTRPGGQPDGSSYMGAWGGWALAPYTASLGGDNPSHLNWSRQGGGTFKRRCNFFNFLAGGSGAKNHCAAGLFVSPAADLSDAMAGAVWLEALVTETSSPAAFLAAGRSETAATGALATAETAAKASASPAPNKSSRPGEPRSRAV